MEYNLNKTRLAEVLLVEDNKDVVILTQQAFKQSHIAVHLHNVKNGIDCMSFLL